MAIDGVSLILLLLVLELAQLIAFWLIIRRRYHFSLRQLGRLTAQMAAGERPKSYFIDGPPPVQQVCRDLESLSTDLEKLQQDQ